MPNIERDNRPASSSGASFFARPSQGIWLVMNCKGPWEGYRRPIVSFPLSFARTFSSRERDVWVWGRQQTWSVTRAGCPMDNKDQLDWPHWLESKEGELLHRWRHGDIVNQMPVCLRWKFTGLALVPLWSEEVTFVVFLYSSSSTNSAKRTGILLRWLN